jgi:hypothetical protein
MSEKAYTIRREDGSQVGPYTFQIIKAFVISKKLHPEDQLLVPQRGEVPLGRIREFAVLFERRQNNKPPSSAKSKPADFLRIPPHSDQWLGRGTPPSAPDLDAVPRFTPLPQQQHKVVVFRGVVLPPGPNPTFAGDLEKNSCVKLLYRFVVGRQTGRLHVRRGRDRIDIFFYQGSLIYASSSSLQTRLGEVLINLDVLSRQVIADAIEQSEAQDIMLGQYLLQEGLLSPKQNLEILNSQLKMRIEEVFTWPSGIYRFYKNEVTGNTLPTSIDPFSFLRQMVFKTIPLGRILDEMENYRNHRVARLVNKLVSIENFSPTSEEYRFYSLLNNKEPLGDLVNMAISQKLLDEDRAMRFLYLLWQVDLIRLAEEIVGSRTKSQISELEERVSRLKEQSLLERLDLSPGSSNSAIRRRYIELAKTYHPDNLPPHSHPRVRKLIQEAFALISEAYHALLSH